MSTVDFLNEFTARYEYLKEDELSLQDYLELCKEDKSAYANPAERL